MSEWPDLLPSLQPWVGEVRGQLIPNRPLAEMTTLRVGGPAQLFFRPADEADLAFFLNRYGQALCDRLIDGLPLEMGQHYVVTP